MIYIKLDGDYIVGVTTLISDNHIDDGYVECTCMNASILFEADLMKYSYRIQDNLIISERIDNTLTDSEAIMETHEITSISAEDNLLNMDLLTSLDDKLNLIMEHLGLC